MKLFISYRSLDSAKVDSIVARLRNVMLSDGTTSYIVWQDKDSITVGRDWWEAIVDAIIDCDVFIFMVSRQSVKNVNCRAELSYARKRNRPVIPLVLEGEFFHNQLTGKNDIDYWDSIPQELIDLRAQFQFYEGTSFLSQMQAAFLKFVSETSRWKDLPAPRPRDPRSANDETNNSIALYDEATDYAWRLEFTSAERLFQRLINTNDPDFGADAREWIIILRTYNELVTLSSSQSTRYKVKQRWENYLELFPNDFIDGVFDPNGLQKQFQKEQNASLPKFPAETSSSNVGSNQSIRPSLVIGLGGVGAGVLSWLKKDLLDSFGSFANEPIRLLLIDTDVYPLENNTQFSLRGYELNSEEFIRIPTDDSDFLIHKLKSSYTSNDLSVAHIKKWWDATLYPDSILNLRDGVGRFRVLGRLSLVQGLTFNGEHDRLYITLVNLVDTVRRIASEGKQTKSLNVYVVGSLSGGIGSAIFMDIAWLIRKILETREIQLRSFVTGFFALPSAFGAGVSSSTQAYAFAAWRELNRMMSVQDQRTAFTLKWGNSEATKSEIHREVFDQVFLVEGGKHPAKADPTKWVFPQIAEAISFMVNENSGTQYIQHIATNLVSIKQGSLRRGNPVYSAFHIKSWKIPDIKFIQQHLLSLEFLRHLLELDKFTHTPQSDDNGYSELPTFADNARYRQRETEPLESTILGTASTPFLMAIASIIRTRDGYKYLIKDATTILSIFIDLPSTKETMDARTQAQDLTSSIFTNLPNTSSNKELEQYLSEIEQTLYGIGQKESLYTRLYGNFSESKAKGEMYETLTLLHNIQLDTFRRRIRDWMIVTLNEPTMPDFSGFACAYIALTQLRIELQALETSVRSSNTHSLALILELQRKAAEERNRVLFALNNKSISAFIANFLGTGAKKLFLGYISSEEDYRLAQQNYRVIERFSDTLQAIVEYLDHIVLTNLKKMLLLLTNGDPLRDTLGIYRLIDESLQLERDERAAAQSFHQTVELLEASEGMVDISHPVPEMLRRVHWSLKEDMGLVFEIRQDNVSSRNPFVIQSDTEQPTEIRKIASALINMFGRYLKHYPSQAAIQALPPDALLNQLQHMVDYSGYTPAMVVPVTASRQFLVSASVNYAESEQISKGLLNLNIPNGIKHNTAFINWNNPNKITMFTSHEMLPPEAFEEWHQCNASYRDMLLGDNSSGIHGDFTRIKNQHVFAGEQEAVLLERQLYREDPSNKDLPLLHHSLVHLLEEKNHLYQLLHMWTLGWIVVKRNYPIDSDANWCIIMPKEYDNAEIKLFRYQKINMIGVLSRYSVYGYSADGEPIPFETIRELLENEMQRRHKSKEETDELLLSYRFESEVAVFLSKALVELFTKYASYLNRASQLNDDLNRLKTKLQRPRHYRNTRLTLAEEVANDLMLSDENENPLVTNSDAHLQLISILGLKYGEWAQQIQTFITEHNHISND